MGAMLSNLSTTINGKKQLVILMIGRGYAGKSTILHQLMHGEFIKINAATIGFDAEPMDYKDISFLFSEVGGQLKMASMWKHYFYYTPALVFVVDSNDRERITEARDELHLYMKEIEVTGKKAYVLVYANKQDLVSAMSVTEVTRKLDFHLLDQQHCWHVQGSSAVTGEGLHDGLDWLYRHLITTATMRIIGVGSIVVEF